MIQEIEFKEKTGKTFEQFHKHYEVRLVGYLKKFRNDENIAKDIADAAFIKALTDIDKYNPEKAQISTWVFTIARNLMLHEIKNSKRFESIEEDHDGATIADFLQSNISNNSEEQELLSIKRIEMVKKGIYELPEKYMKILLMRHIDGLSYEEIAKFEKMKLNTIKSRIRGGKLLLQKKLARKMQKLNETGY